MQKKCKSDVYNSVSHIIACVNHSAFFFMEKVQRHDTSQAEKKLFMKTIDPQKMYMSHFCGRFHEIYAVQHVKFYKYQLASKQKTFCIRHFLS